MSEFVARNSAFLITMTGIVIGAMGMCLTCILRSRCSKIKVCGIECDREVISEGNLGAVEVTGRT